MRREAQRQHFNNADPDDSSTESGSPSCLRASAVTGAMTESSGMQTTRRRLNVWQFLISSSLFPRRTGTMRAISQRRREPALGANPETPGMHLDLFGTHASNTARLRAEVASLDVQRQQVASVDAL